jgi:hypothetical protein
MTIDNILSLVQRLRLQKSLIKTWIPHHYPSSTFAMKKDEAFLPLKAIQSWPEYSSLAQGEVLVTIEHCSNCSEHCLYTHHKEEHYVGLAAVVELVMREVAHRFDVSFDVIMKPVNLAAECSSPDRAGEAEKTTFHEFKGRSDVVEGVSTSLRTGAFEVQVRLVTTSLSNFQLPCLIQVAFNSNGHVTTHLLYSKLYRGEWPKKRLLRARLSAILSRVGRFKLRNHKEPESVGHSAESRAGAHAEPRIQPRVQPRTEPRLESLSAGSGDKMSTATVTEPDVGHAPVVNFSESRSSELDAPGGNLTGKIRPRDTAAAGLQGPNTESVIPKGASHDEARPDPTPSVVTKNRTPNLSPAVGLQAAKHVELNPGLNIATDSVVDLRADANHNVDDTANTTARAKNDDLSVSFKPTVQVISGAKHLSEQLPQGQMPALQATFDFAAPISLYSPSTDLNTNSLLEGTGGDFGDLILEGSLTSNRSGESVHYVNSQYSQEDSSENDDQYAKFLVSAQQLETERKESIIGLMKAQPAGGSARITSTIQKEPSIPEHPPPRSQHLDGGVTADVHLQSASSSHHSTHSSKDLMYSDDAFESVLHEIEDSV